MRILISACTDKAFSDGLMPMAHLAVAPLSSENDNAPLAGGHPLAGVERILMAYQEVPYETVTVAFDDDAFGEAWEISASLAG